MNSVFVYCEIEEGTVADVSLELLTKGRALATKLGVKLEAIALGEGLKDVEKQVFPYGVDVLWVGDDARLAPYTTLPHTKMLVRLFDAEKPQVALMGATSVGRDLGPRVSSALHSGLTADCTSLEIGEYTEEAIESNKCQYIVKRVELKDKVYEDEKYLELFEEYEDTVKYDKYENYIETFFDDITVDEAVAAEYTVADTYLSKYADLYYQQWWSSYLSSSS